MQSPRQSQSSSHLPCVYGPMPCGHANHHISARDQVHSGQEPSALTSRRPIHARVQLMPARLRSRSQDDETMLFPTSSWKPGSPRCKQRHAARQKENTLLSKLVQSISAGDPEPHHSRPDFAAHLDKTCYEAAVDRCSCP